MIKVDVSKGIQVGGYTWSVDASEDAHRRLIGDADYGHCDSRNKIIRIEKGESEVENSNTILHEMMEAISCIYLCRTLDHNQLTQIANAIHQVMEGLGVRFVCSNVKDTIESYPL